MYFYIKYKLETNIHTQSAKQMKLQFPELDLSKFADDSVCKASIFATMRSKQWPSEQRTSKFIQVHL